MSSTPEIEKLVVVALVEVLLTATRLVIVDVALLTSIPPVNVKRVDVALEGNGYPNVDTLKQPSEFPDASTPKGALPAEQFVPLAARAVARLARPVKLPYMPPEAVSTPVIVVLAFNVELAVVRSPLRNPIVVEVATP
jgi:hypothetical protein